MTAALRFRISTSNTTTARQTTADAYLVGVVSSDDRPYPSTRVGTGCPYVVVNVGADDTIWNGFPTFLFELSVKLYDPSQDDTVGGSGSHRYADPTTWGGDGDNFPAVQMYNVLRGIYYGGAWFYGLQNTTAARLPVANWIAQIAKCRAAITGDSGDEPTYRTGMQISVNAQPVNAITTLLTGCQGKISEIGGFYKLFLGEPESPTFSFTDDDILSTEQQVFRPFFALADSVNGIQATYPDPDAGVGLCHRASLLPHRPRSQGRQPAADGLARLRRRALCGAGAAAAEFGGPGGPARAHPHHRAAAGILDRRARRSRDLDVPAQRLCRQAVPARRFDRQGQSRYRHVAHRGRPVRFRLGPCDRFQTGHVRSDHDHAAGAAGGAFHRLGGGAGTLNDTAGVARRPAIELSWDGTLPGIVGVQYEVRLTADASDVTKGRTDQFAAGAILVSQSLIPATAYQVRGQYLPSNPRNMLWSDWIDVTTPDVLISLADLDAAIAYQVTTLQDAFNDQLNGITQQIAALASNFAARGEINKQQVRSDLTSVFGTASAEISNIQTAYTAADAALATDITTVSASVGGLSASITANTSAIATLSGYTAAQYSDTQNDNG